MSSTGECSASTSRTTGSWRYRSTRSDTAASRVAENRSLCPRFGVASRIARTSRMNPRSAMWSASSITDTSMASSRTCRCSMRSSRRPGHAMITSAPRRIASICGLCPTPPYTVAYLTPRTRPNDAKTSRTWLASSRVGTRIRPLGGRLPARDVDSASRVSIGTMKASVLPDPVLPRPSTSRPASASGMVCAWMSVGTVMPSARSTSMIRGSRPIAAKVVGAVATVAIGGFMNLAPFIFTRTRCPMSAVVRTPTLPPATAQRVAGMTSICTPSTKIDRR